MFSASELEGIPAGAVKSVEDMQTRIMEEIVRRIQVAGEITSTTDWEMQRLSQLGMTETEIKKSIQDMLNYTDKEIDDLYTRTLQEGYVRDESLYKAAGQGRPGFNQNKDLQKIIAAAQAQTRGSFQNMTQSLGFAKNVGGKVQFTSLAEFYQRELDSAVMDIVSGSASYEQVLKRVVNEMTTSGLRTIDYASGRSYRVESAARTAITTGFNQVVGKMTDTVAAELGIDHFEVSWHGGARPSHQEWQGRVYSKKQLEEVCGLGRVDGLLGANCYHSYNPFYPGISKRNYSDKWLEKMTKEENAPKMYQGKEYTKYEALQEQRKMELKMRKLRQDIDLMTKGKGDADDILNLQIKYAITQDRYVDFSAQMELPQQMQRVTIQKIGKRTQLRPSKTGGMQGSASGGTMSARDILNTFDRKARIFTVEEDIKATNPNFSTKERKWTHNCQRCVPAYEMRRRGYNVTVKPRPPGNSDELALRPWNAWNSVRPQTYRDKDDIEKTMAAWGDGARAQIVCVWKTGGGHTFIAEQQNGKTVFLDPQTGSMDCAWYFSQVRAGAIKNVFYRIDKVSPTGLIGECCK